MKFRRSITSPIREFIDMDHRWRDKDDGIIWCWESGREMAKINPLLAERAKSGELMILTWRGGVSPNVKMKKKEGTYKYLAQWQGLAGKDLDLDIDIPVTLTCTVTGVNITFSKDGWKTDSVETMKFFALDVETANADMSSICQIGIVEFEDGKAINQWGTFVNPDSYFDPFNVSIHGISYEMVRNAPRFPEIYSQIQEWVKNNIVVTHMSFDQNSLRRASQKYALPEISCTWLDSARVVRRQWEQFRQSGYSLSNIAEYLEIKYKAHDAVDDARAAGEVVVKAMEQSGQSIQEWLERAYKRQTGNVNYAREGNPDGPFFGETIVFTGALSLPRKDAAQLAAQAGCNVGDSVNKTTSILVVGVQDHDRLAGYDKSSKHRKAEELINKGQQIRIISENDFVEMIEL